MLQSSPHHQPPALLKKRKHELELEARAGALSSTTAIVGPVVATPQSTVVPVVTSVTKKAARTTEGLSRSNAKGVTPTAIASAVTTAVPAALSTNAQPTAAVTPSSRIIVGSTPTARLTSSTPGSTLASSSNNSSSAHKSSNTTLIVVVVVIFSVIVLLIAGFFGYRKYRSKKATRDPNNLGFAGYDKHDEDEFGNNVTHSNSGGGGSFSGGAMGPNFGHDNSGGGEKFGGSNGYGTLAQSSPGPIAGMAGRGAGARSPPMTAGFSGENGRWNSMDGANGPQGNGQGQLPHFQAYEKNLNGSPSLPPLPHSDSPWSPHTPVQPYGSPNQPYANASPHHQSWNAHLSGAPSSQLSPSNSLSSPLGNSNSNSLHGYPPPQSSASGGSSRQLLSPYAGTTEENDSGHQNERLSVASNGFGFLGPVIGTGVLQGAGGSSSQLPPPVGSQAQQSYNDRAQMKSNSTMQGDLSRIEETSREIEGDSYDVTSPFGEMEGEGEDKMQGEIRVVKRSFDPTMPDELIVFPGDRVQLLQTYDDGWALGINLESGNDNKGVFPYDCLADRTQTPPSVLSKEARAHSPQPPQQSNPDSAPSPSLPSSVLSESEYKPMSPRPHSPFDTREFYSTEAPHNEGIERLTVPPSVSSSSLSPGAGNTKPIMERSETPLDIPGSFVDHRGNNREGDKSRRTSSLLNAGRDASLFVALGEALDHDHDQSREGIRK